jgi:hypothetical protein
MSNYLQIIHKFQKKIQTSEEEKNRVQSSIAGVRQHEASGQQCVRGA